MQIEIDSNEDFIDNLREELYTEETKKIDTSTEVAKKEKNDNARPELKEKVKNIEEYDIIFIGFPNWWGTMPMPILTFLESYKLEGKIVIPFCTHGGGGEQSCFRDFVKNTSKATNKKGFITSGGAASSARPQVEKWLKEIDIIK